MLNKFFGVLFSGTAQAIEAIKIGQTDLKKQIKAAVNIIEGIQASHTAQSDKFNSNQNATTKRIDTLKQELDAVSGFYSACTDGIKANVSALCNDISEINLRNHSDSLIFSQLWAEIDALKKQVSELIAKPEIIPVSDPVESMPIKATAKARTMSQPRVKTKVKNYTGGLSFENDFSQVLRRALKHTAKRGILPCLSNVLITAENNTLTVHSTDLESGYTATLSTLKNWGKSQFLIPRDIAETLSKAKSEISLEWDYSTSTVKIEAGSYKTQFVSLLPGDFPRLPCFEAENLIISDSPELIPALIKSGKAQAIDTAKSILTGTVLNRVGGYNIDVASTDGYRLFVENIASVNHDWKNSGLIIPSSIIKRLSDYKAHSQVSVFNTDSHIQFELATGEKLYSRLIEGKYPDYNKILPKSFSHQISFDTEELKQVLTSLKHAVNPQTKVFTFSFKKDGTLQFETRNDSGPTAIKIDYKNLLKSDLPEISFNQACFSEMINLIDSETIEFYINSEIQPAIMRGSDNDKRQIMIMPIKP